MKVVLESSPYFKLISPTDVCRKVAPGMPSTFHILFTPEENKVRPEVPGGWCLLVEHEPMGLDSERMRKCVFRDFSWFQWGCAGFRTERVLHHGGGPTQAVGSCFNLLLCFSISCLVGVSVLVHVIVVRALLMGTHSMPPCLFLHQDKGARSLGAWAACSSLICCLVML